jgi:hypothetical protein
MKKKPKRAVRAPRAEAVEFPEGLSGEDIRLAPGSVYRYAPGHGCDEMLFLRKGNVDIDAGEGKAIRLRAGGVFVPPSDRPITVTAGYVGAVILAVKAKIVQDSVVVVPAKPYQPLEAPDVYVPPTPPEPIGDRLNMADFGEDIKAAAENRWTGAAIEPPPGGWPREPAREPAGSAAPSAARTYTQHPPPGGSAPIARGPIARRGSRAAEQGRAAELERAARSRGSAAPQPVDFAGQPVQPPQPTNPGIVYHNGQAFLVHGNQLVPVDPAYAAQLSPPQAPRSSGATGNGGIPMGFDGPGVF